MTRARIVEEESEGGGPKVECRKLTSRKVGFIANDMVQGHDQEIGSCGRMVGMINGEVQEIERLRGRQDSLCVHSSRN